MANGDECEGVRKACSGILAWPGPTALGLVSAFSAPLGAALQPHLPAPLLQVGRVPPSTFSELSLYWLAFETKRVATCCAGSRAATLGVWASRRQPDGLILHSVDLLAIAPKPLLPQPNPLRRWPLLSTPLSRSRRGEPRHHHNQHFADNLLSDDTDAISKHSTTTPISLQLNPIPPTTQPTKQTFRPKPSECVTHPLSSSRWSASLPKHHHHFKCQ